MNALQQRAIDVGEHARSWWRRHEFGDVVIGTLTVPAHEMTRTYETASWYTKIAMPTQTVDLRVAYSLFNGQLRAHAAAELHGTITGSCFTSRLFHASAHHCDEDVGQPDSQTLILATLDHAGWTCGSYGTRLNKRPLHRIRASMKTEAPATWTPS